MVRDDLRAGDEVREIHCRCGGSCYRDTLRHDAVARYTFGQPIVEYSRQERKDCRDVGVQRRP